MYRGAGHNSHEYFSRKKFAAKGLFTKNVSPIYKSSILMFTFVSQSNHVAYQSAQKFASNSMKKTVVEKVLFLKLEPKIKPFFENTFGA